MGAATTIGTTTARDIIAPVEPALVADQPTPLERLLTIDAPVESRQRRAAGLLFAILITLAFALFTHAYWTPANAGVDQNGYLVGGRMFAETLSTGFKPQSPFEFVGGMWVLTDDGWVYPKYPLGMPMLVASAFWIGGDAHGPVLAYCIAPTCAGIGLFATFLLAREIAGSFAGVIASLLFATNPVLLAMANSPWSHAPALAFVAVGMLLMLRWWRCGGVWRGVIAGLLLGYAVLIRYTEALLVLPMAIVILDKLRWRDARSWTRGAAPVIAWLIPVLFLLIFNKLAMGTWTGYDTTHESTGFKLAQLWEKLPSTFDLLNSSGAYFILPLGVLGMLLLVAANWRLGLFLLAWIVPGIILYSCYYWGEAVREMGYLRFFLTALPVIVAAGAWMLHRVTQFDPRIRRGFGVAAVGVVVAIASASNLSAGLPQLERELTNGSNLAEMTDVLKFHTRGADAGDVVLFTDTSAFMSPANHLQFATWFEMYSTNAFSKDPQSGMRGPPGRGPPGFGPGGADESEPQPSPIQPKRREFLTAEYAKYDDPGLVRKQNELMQTALLRGRRVLVLAPPEAVDGFVSRYVADKFSAVTLAQWREPLNLFADLRGIRGGAPGGPGGPRDVRRGARGDQRGPPPLWPNNPPSPRRMRLIEIKRK